MEDNKGVYRFLGKPTEDFHLCCGRTKAALESKELLIIIEEDVVGKNDEVSDLDKKNVATARPILIR